MTFRNLLALSLVFAIVACTSVAQAVPIFYLSTSNVAGAPANLNLSGAAGSTGTLYLWGNSTDVQVGGVSLNVTSANSALKFTNPVAGPALGNNWSFVANPTLAGDGLSLTGFNAAAIPGPGAVGFGGASSAGPTLLLGSMGYILGASGESNISMFVGANEITDYAGDYPNVRFGTANGPTGNGGVPGQGGVVGTASVGGVIPEPATLSLVGLAIVGALGFCRRRS